MRRTLLLVAPILLASANLAQAQTSQPITPLAQAQATVDGWYRQFLGRLPDPAAGAWVLALVNGRSAGDILGDILSSREYFTRAGGTNAGFVRQLYLDQLGRTPTTAELFFWVDFLRIKSRKTVALQFLASQGNIVVAIIQNQNQRRRR